MKLRALPLAALLAAGVQAQETPRPNRVVWMEIFPEPLPEGVSEVALEATSQFLRPDMWGSGDGRTQARLDGEEWQLTGDWAWSWGDSRFNVRARLDNRSGGIADQAFASWHTLLGTPQGGRELVPKYQFDFTLQRDGVVIADQQHPDTRLMALDLAWIRPFGDRAFGGRLGASVQLPNGSEDHFTGDGGTNFMAGGAVWKRFGHWRVQAQAEHVVLDLRADSRYRMVLAHEQFNRAWAGLGWAGEGPGFWRGFGLDVSLGVTENPYRVGIPRVDRAGWQQHWTVTHRALPRWRFGLSEEAGTYVAPDLTLFAAYRIGGEK